MTVDPRTMPTSIAVVGPGYSPYLVALAMLRRLGPASPSITVVELPEVKPDRALVSLHAAKDFHNSLNISEPDFLGCTNADINFGFQYHGWSQSGPSFFSDAEYGFIVQGLTFQHLYHAYRSLGGAANYDDFCIASCLAKRDKYYPKSDNPRSVFSAVSYGYRVNAESYKRYLKGLLKQAVVQLHSCRVDQISVTLDGQAISSISLGSGSLIAADLFIDCSREGVLARQLSSEALNFREFLPNWRDVTSTEPYSKADSRTPYSTIIRRDQGIGFIYPGAEGLVRRELTVAGANGTAPEEHAWQQPTRRLRAWQQNCVALGEAFASLPCTLLDECYLLQSQISFLLDLWPAQSLTDQVRGAFNAASNLTVERMMELSNMHFICHPDLNAAIVPCDVNQRRMALFQQCGKTFSLDGDVLESNHWPALFYALGLKSVGSDALVEQVGRPWIHEQLNKMHQLFSSAAQSAPPYTEWLEQRSP